MDKIMLFIPMYNCEKQIVRVLSQIDNKVIKFISEIVIINNRSTDNGEKAVINYLEKNKLKTKVTLLKNDENYNLGGSHKVAFNYAIKNKYDYLIVLHGDDQGNINDLLPYLKNKEYRNYDCLLGSRFMKKSKLLGYSKFRTFGNIVYNIIFSIALGKNIKDLGSGLNMYNTKILKDNFYIKYPDKLTFNCYMLLASKSYKHKIKFFPISWREDDQVSNVKMFSQAMITLNLVINYFFKRKKFLESEHRNKIVDNYSATKVYRSDNSER